MSDPYDLERFLSAQEPVIGKVMSELNEGHKQTHWMWFVFPQIHGLGRSEIAQRYAISSSSEAMAYLGHPVLGPRLEECALAVLKIAGRTAHQVFGEIDALKFRSSMTLFAAVSHKTAFRDVLDKYFDGDLDPVTLKILGDE